MIESAVCKKNNSHSSPLYSEIGRKIFNFFRQSKLRNKSIVFVLSVTSILSASEEKTMQSISSHFILRDYSNAMERAKKAVAEFPLSHQLRKHLIRASLECGDEKTALFHFHLLSENERKDDYELIESIAWGILKKGESSSQMDMRLIAMLGAFYTNDAKAVSTLLKKLRSTSAKERAFAVYLSSLYRDEILQDEIVQLFKKENVWYVRLELIRAIGRMGIYHLSGDLRRILDNQKAALEERYSAMESLLMLYEKIELSELMQLLKSNRAALRQFAAQLVLHLDFKEALPLIAPLIEDPSSEVRISALNTFGILGIPFLRENREILNKIQDALFSKIPEISITASWVLLPIAKEPALAMLEMWLKEGKDDERRLAACALSRSGKLGEQLSITILKESKDPFVKANLAMGLIGGHAHLTLACNALFTFLNECKDRLMWASVGNPLFKALAPSDIRHVPQMPNYPDMVDKMTRLSVLNILAMMRYEKSQELIKTFIQEGNWAIGTSAVLALLQEGEGETVDLIRNFIQHSNEEIRFQAALAIAFLDKDPEVLDILMKAYPVAKRQLKMHIIEAVGHLGTVEAIPFLLKIFEEPFQTLRIVAACALIQCIYH
jgi:HEAT repeat protein